MITAQCDTEGASLAPTDEIERQPFISRFFEVRDPEPGVRVILSQDGGEDCWTEYPESVGLWNSYSDSCSD